MHSLFRTAALCGCCVLILSWVATAQAVVVAMYPLDGSADDTSGNGLDGVVFEAMPTTDRFGTAGGALLFDDVDDFVEIPNTGGDFDLPGAFSVAAWAMTLASSSDNRNEPIVWKIADPGTNQDNFLISWQDGDVFRFGFENTNGQDFAALSSIKTPGQWYHIAGTFDGNDLTIYVDGVLEQVVMTGAQTVFTGAAPLRFGNILHSNHGNRGVFNGAIDDVKIFDHALSAAEVRELAGIPEPSSILLLLFATGLVLARMSDNR